MKTIGFGFAGLLLVVGAAVDASGADKEKGKPAVYKTPEALMDAFESSQKKKEWKTFIECWAPKAQKRVTAFEVRYAVGRRRIAQELEEARERGKPVFDILDKHGLTLEATKTVKADPILSDEIQKDLSKLVPLIKDPMALFVELNTAFDKLGWSSGPKIHPSRMAKLIKVKINGDKATGVLGVTEGDRRYEVPFDFVKIDGSWRLPPVKEDE
jgi:hypothetical protein